MTEIEMKNVVPVGTVGGLAAGGLAGDDGDLWLRTLLGTVLDSSEELVLARTGGVVSEEYAAGLAERFATGGVTVEDVYVLCALYGFTLKAVMPPAQLTGSAEHGDEGATL